MKKLTAKHDPTSKLEAARGQLDAVQAQIGQLEAERNTALVGDSVEDVIRLDRLLNEQRRAAVVHTDRIAALQVEMRRQEHAAKERARDEAIKDILEPFAAECVGLAAELETALKRACAAFSKLDTKRAEMASRWPAAVPRPRYYGLEFFYLQRRLFQSHETWHGDRFVHELERRLPEVAQEVRNSLARLIDACRQEQIPAPPEPEPVEPEPSFDDEEIAA